MYSPNTKWNGGKNPRSKQIPQIRQTPDNVGETIKSPDHLWSAYVNKQSVWWNRYTNPIPAACVVNMQFRYVMEQIARGEIKIYKKKSKQ